VITRFLRFTIQHGNVLATLDTNTWLLWSNKLTAESVNKEDASNILENAAFGNLSGWELPSIKELKAFASRTGNPFRSEEKFRLRTAEGGTARYLLAKEGAMDVEEENLGEVSQSSAPIFAVHYLCNRIRNHNGFVGLIFLLAERQWQLSSINGKLKYQLSKQEARDNWRSLAPLQLMFVLAEHGEVLRIDGHVFPSRLIQPFRFSLTLTTGLAASQNSKKRI